MRWGEDTSSWGWSWPPSHPGRFSPGRQQATLACPVPHCPAQSGHMPTADPPDRDGAGLAALLEPLPSSVLRGKNHSREKWRTARGHGDTGGAAWGHGMGWHPNSHRGQPARGAGAGVTDLSQQPAMGFSCLLEARHPQPRSPGTATAAGWGRRWPLVPFCSVRRIRPAETPRFIQLNPAAGRSPPAPGRARVPGSAPAGAGPRGTVPPRREGTEVMKFVNGECLGGWSRGSPRGAGHSLRAAQAGWGCGAGRGERAPRSQRCTSRPRQHKSPSPSRVRQTMPTGEKRQPVMS